MESLALINLSSKTKKKKRKCSRRQGITNVIFLIPINFFVLLCIFLTLGISFRYNYLSNQNSFRRFEQQKSGIEIKIATSDRGY